MANWASSKKRALIRRRGTEHVRDDSASMVRRVVRGPSTDDPQRPPRKSKEALRADAAAAFIAWREKRAATGQ
jgi:hypothetical protein